MSGMQPAGLPGGWRLTSAREMREMREDVRLRRLTATHTIARWCSGRVPERGCAEAVPRNEQGVTTPLASPALTCSLEQSEQRDELVTKILVVDDEQSIVELIRGYLEREGFEVFDAFDGPTAVERARELTPELVVLDVMLPGLDGIEVCRQIRQFSDAYVLMLTARAEEVDRIVGLTVGADDYLAKPFSPRELVARIRDASPPSYCWDRAPRPGNRSRPS